MNHNKLKKDAAIYALGVKPTARAGWLGFGTLDLENAYCAGAKWGHERGMFEGIEASARVAEKHRVGGFRSQAGQEISSDIRTLLDQKDSCNG